MSSRLHFYAPIIGSQPSTSTSGAISPVKGTAVVPANLTAAGQTVGLDVSELVELTIGIVVGAPGGTTPSLAFFLEWSPDDGGTWLLLNAPAAITAAGSVTLQAGAGVTAIGPFGYMVRLRWTVTGTAGPTFPVSAWLFGK